MDYKEIIHQQMFVMTPSMSWWPKYFYHFTNIENALGIISKGWIYGRREAVQNHLMETDNASLSVISISQNNIQEYARLYFRPRTPTQYHNEGYKPKHVRQIDINANCPVPIFFFLDSYSVLNLADVKFSESSCAGMHDLNLLSGEEAFSRLPFDKIYHDRSFTPDQRDDIIQHRQAEIVRQHGFPIENTLKGIFCRSIAEKETLLYRLSTQYPEAYKKYHHIIRFTPSLNLFYNNGIFIKKVECSENKIFILFNDPSKRYGRCKSQKDDFRFDADLYYQDINGQTINRATCSLMLDYAQSPGVNLKINEPVSQFAILEIRFDNILMYQNSIDLSTDILI